MFLKEFLNQIFLMLVKQQDINLTLGIIQNHITLNKNTIIGDKSAITPGGVRIGTPAVTTRGYNAEDMKQVGRFIDEVFKISLKI